ncbi:MAG: GYDIA family GHMP kinase [Leeuwenhoekiella sp.]
MNSTFYSHGKLLLTAEYAVLDGALALALPTKKGQSLTVEPSDENGILWQSFDVNGQIWIEESVDYSEIFNFSLDAKVSDPRSRLLQLLAACRDLNPQFLTEKSRLKVSTHLEFPQDWGLGSSSTLVSNLAQWANVNPYELLEKTFGGSGYDLACAGANTAITYRRDKFEPQIKAVSFQPEFYDQLFFVHLNKKQNSRQAIAHYRNQPLDEKAGFIEKVGSLTKQILQSKTLKDFCALIDEHEQVLGAVLQLKPIKEELFPDYPGSIKSLGGWGGDFVLATGEEAPDYFQKKGFETIIPFEKMVL